uniref:NADH-ubiquinone oxidoreductase chain 2 n=1 Tax=Typhlatya miravetensis TaxID=390490 RepID=A0A2H1DQQ9_9EUCA|nr:NADH dehydrogenase subunit 2 [Typhlatya miravetensis]SCN12532.1 NADH dehydrogenase subunit 2 [Typhlatya miravetensis]
MLTLKPHQLLFYTTLLIGILVAVSSSSWFILWMGLELNLMSFIPIMTSSNNRYSAESALKYFLIQALGSASLLAASPLSMIFHQTALLIIFIALLLKVGAAPLHFWFPPVMQGISWLQSLTLMTVQKIAPISMMSMLISNLTTPVIMTSSIFSAIVGGIGGLNQTLTRKIMSYSSINHMAWLLSAISFNESLWLIYFSSYTLISSSVVMILYYNQIFHINQLLTTNLSSKPLKLSLLSSLLSLGGLPPLLGFLPKMMVIQEFITAGASLIWLSILLFSALLTLFFYLRMTLSSLTLSSPKMKTNLTSSSARFMLSLSFINLTPLLYPFILMVIY